MGDFDAAISSGPRISGAAMSYLSGFATDAYNTAKEYMEEMEGYILQGISFSVSDIDVPTPGTIIVDPTIGTPPVSPTTYPTVPPSPTTQDFAFPADPVYVIPSAPTLTDITIPEFVEGVITPLSTSIPVIDFDVPSLSAIVDGGMAPEDELVQASKAKLLSNIVNGGTMIDPAVEADIWNRDRERRVQALQDARDKLTAQWAKLNWSIPDGLLAGAMLAVENEYMNKDLDASREIAIKQAELEQKGMFESLKLGIDLETVLISNFNEYAKRVHDTSKSNVDALIELYKQRVAQFNAMLEAYKTDVMAYKTQIEAEMVRAEVYKARLASLELLTKIDDNRVKIYISHIGAIEQLVKIYQTEVQAVGIKYEAEKQKIDGFKARVDAYVAQVDGLTKRYLGEVEGYKSFVSAWSASADAQTKFGELKLKAELGQVEAELKVREQDMRHIEEENKLKLENIKTLAVISSNLAAGALSAIHAQVSDSYQNSFQYSQSHQYSY